MATNYAHHPWRPAGTGKTTIARELARQLRAVHVRIDSIEEAILDSGVLSSSIDDAGYRVGNAVAADNLRIGRTVIADSVNLFRFPAMRGSKSRTVPVSAVESRSSVQTPKNIGIGGNAHIRRSRIAIPYLARRSLTRLPPWNRDHIVIDTPTGPSSRSSRYFAERCQKRHRLTPHRLTAYATASR